MTETREGPHYSAILFAWSQQRAISFAMREIFETNTSLRRIPFDSRFYDSFLNYCLLMWQVDIVKEDRDTCAMALVCAMLQIPEFRFTIGKYQ